jgi:hypothetical protein
MICASYLDISGNPPASPSMGCDGLFTFCDWLGQRDMPVLTGVVGPVSPQRTRWLR